MLSPNAKPCEVARKPTNYSYGKTFTCEGKEKKKKRTLNKVGKAKAREMFHYGKTPTCEDAMPLTR